MTKPSLSLTEKSVLAFVLLMLAVGYYLYYTNLSSFLTYVHEDGIIEWLTVVGLMLGCGVCILRFKKLRKYRNWWFLFVVADLALMLFFVSGEEISWGQRIFGIKSPEFFIEHNTQKELNFHNLIADGIKINKVIFSFGLIAAMGIYLVVVPLVYRNNQKLKNWLDHSGVPIPRLYQIISVLLLFVLVEIIPHPKKAEILEAGIAFLFFLIIRYPANYFIFKKDYQLR